MPGPDVTWLIPDGDDDVDLLAGMFDFDSPTELFLTPIPLEDALTEPTKTNWRDQLNAARQVRETEEEARRQHDAARGAQYARQRGQYVSRLLQAAGLPVEDPGDDKVMLGSYTFSKKTRDYRDALRISRAVPDAIAIETLPDGVDLFQYRHEVEHYIWIDGPVLDPLILANTLDELDDWAEHARARNSDVMQAHLSGSTVEALNDIEPPREAPIEADPDHVLVVWDPNREIVQDKLNAAYAQGWRLFSVFDNEGYITAILTRDGARTVLAE